MNSFVVVLHDSYFYFKFELPEFFTNCEHISSDQFACKYMLTTL